MSDGRYHGRDVTGTEGRADEAPGASPSLILVEEHGR